MFASLEPAPYVYIYRKRALMTRHGGALYIDIDISLQIATVTTTISVNATVTTTILVNTTLTICPSANATVTPTACPLVHPWAIAAFTIGAVAKVSFDLPKLETGTEGSKERNAKETPGRKPKI